MPDGFNAESVRAFQVIEFMHLDGFIIDPEGEE